MSSVHITRPASFFGLLEIPVKSKTSGRPFSAQMRKITGHIPHRIGINLRRLKTQSQSSGGTDYILCPKSDKPHFKGGHLRRCPNSHGITRTGIKRRIPGLMMPIHRIMRMINPGCPSGSADYGFSLYYIKTLVSDPKTHDPGCSSFPVDQVVCSHYPVDYLHIMVFYRLSQQWFQIFPIYLYIPSSPRDIGPIGFFLNRQTHLFDFFYNFIKALCCGQNQILPNQAHRVIPYIFRKTLRGFSWVQVSIDGVHTRSQTTASFDLSLFHDHHLSCWRSLLDGNCRQTPGGPPSNDHYINK